jgi:hypothetical protein
MLLLGFFSWIGVSSLKWILITHDYHTFGDRQVGAERYMLGESATI